MKKLMLTMSLVAALVTMTACKNAEAIKQGILEPEKQEREFLRDAIHHRTPDLQRVDLIGNTVVYTHIYDGIVDVKTYTFDGDLCVEVERVYTFPNQMSALRHYRRAVERAQLYDNIELFNNEVKYNLKEELYKLETDGLTKDQLKEKFDKQITDAKADMKRYGKDIERDMKCCDKKASDKK